ncbi:MAG TPA: ABC transporter permease [Anaerolineales bacterium]|nr:ABC transporter permease [Anaerolineales bacterium]
MNITEVLRISWEAIGKNKVRSLLTMLGIIIGVAAVIMMIAVSNGTASAIASQITSLGSNLIFISPNFTRNGPQTGAEAGTGLVFTDAAAIEQQVPNVAGVSVEQGTTETVKAGAVSLSSINILGSLPDFPTVRDMKVASGSYFTQSDQDHKTKVAVLGSGLAQQLFGTADPIGQTVQVGNFYLDVVGVMAPKGMVGDVDYDARLYLPLSTVLQYYTPSQFARFLGQRVRTIYVTVSDPKKMNDTIDQITLLLEQRHKVSATAPDFTITTQQNIITTQESTTAAFRNLLAWVAGISLIVGGIGIMNIMLVSVTERTREIGLRQSVGATPNDIRWQFLSEALLLSVIGGLIGILVGVGGSWIFGAVGTMKTVVAPSSIFLAFFSAAAVGAFFGYYPANQAAQLDPIDALRHE